MNFVLRGCKRAADNFKSDMQVCLHSIYKICCEKFMLSHSHWSKSKSDQSKSCLLFTFSCLASSCYFPLFLLQWQRHHYVNYDYGGFSNDNDDHDNNKNVRSDVNRGFLAVCLSATLVSISRDTSVVLRVGGWLDDHDDKNVRSDVTLSWGFWQSVYQWPLYLFQEILGRS